MDKKIENLICRMCSEETGDVGYIMDLLYDAYIDTMLADRTKITRLFQNLERRLASLPFAERDKIQCEVNALCAEHERIAFGGGFRAGACFMLELIDR